MHYLLQFKIKSVVNNKMSMLVSKCPSENPQENKILFFCSSKHADSLLLKLCVYLTEYIDLFLCNHEQATTTIFYSSLLSFCYVGGRASFKFT